MTMTKAHIAILDDYQDVVKNLPCYATLADYQVSVFTRPPENFEDLVQRLQDVDGVVLIRERTVISRDLLARLPKLKLISQTGKVAAHIDLQACQEYGVSVVDGTGSPIAPAELTWTLLMAAQRRLTAYVQNLQAGKWQQSGDLGLGHCLAGKTLGIWGYGKIGQRMARYAQAFDMQVLVWGREASLEKALEDGHKVAKTKSDFFASSDILTLHLRLNEHTQNCVHLQDLMLMKTSALLINTSRAELIEADALYQALQSGRPGFAALDVYAHEPASAESEPLIGLPNVLASPHLGFVEASGYELYFSQAFNNLDEYFSANEA